MDAQDSGWRLFAGDESQEYVNDPQNSGIYQPAQILMIDDSIAELLQQPVGAAFEREDGTAEWRAAEGLDLSDGDELETQFLGGAWHMDISGMFERSEEEEGDTIFVAEGRTVRVAIWDFSDKTIEEIVEIHRAFIQDRDQSEHPTLEYMQSETDGVIRMGFIVEESEEEHRYKVLYGYTIVGTEVAQGAFYYDDDSDQQWAIDTWTSMSCLAD
jgi:hypothetical protein